MLRSGFCDYTDAYIVVKGTIDLEVAGKYNKKGVPFKKIMLHLGHAYQKSIRHS